MSGDSESAQVSTSPAALVADFVQSLRPVSVLIVGDRDGGGPLVEALGRRGIDAAGTSGDAVELGVTQLPRRFDVIVLDAVIARDCDAHVLRGLVHFCASHLLPSGAIICGDQHDGSPNVPAFEALCAESELELLERCGGWDRRPVGDGDFVVSVHRRTSRFNVHDLLFEARSSIRRLTVYEVNEQLRTTEPPIVIDTRTDTDRMRFGVIDGALHAPRTVVEWHLDPANGYRHPALHSFDQPIIVVCNGGYSSSLSAAHLARIGFTTVADMIGGMAAWIHAGLPTVVPSDSYLGY
ncbi:MAG: hypothetical protein QOE00_814 [Ilumatobacteraceae bacterium]